MAFDETQPSYLALREKVVPDTKRLVIWCGAGLSRPAGILTWGELRQRLEQQLRDKGRHLEPKERQSIEKRVDWFQGEKNHWVAFGFIQRELGQTSYREAVKEILAPGSSSAIPQAYLKLWQLRLAGVVSLNLDPLGQRAHSNVHGGKRLVTFTGNKVGDHMHVLRNPTTPFLCQLHGQDTDVSTWVFTHDELSGLMKTPAYHTFIHSILTTDTVLFVGISADDVAVGGHLERLVQQKIDFGAHFWVTDRNDRETERWADQAAIRTIHYRSRGSDHSELLEMLTALARYVPHDDGSRVYPPAHLGSSLTPVQTLPSPEELRTLPADEIRTMLNRKALDILRPSNSRQEQEFSEFVEEYDYAIHNAWFVSTAEGKNSLVGYKLKERKNKGAFGQIYKAEDAEGNMVAIKLLKEEVRTEPLLLHSFRRGVQAMRILSENHVSGMVPYKEASEIPAFVAMDWIDGYDLRQAVEMNLLDSWESVLQVALGIASILKEAHSLPQRVLHRDLRPANVMLKKDLQGAPWKVFLLDFDLSWYLGSIEQSVVHGSDSYGFLAPEQIRQREGTSSRHPAVDSYGLGMTLYFMLSGTSPSPNQHLHTTWRQDVLSIATRRRKKPWASVGDRFARMILNLTHDRQSVRWDLAQVVLELQRMLEAIRQPNRIRFADMLAEEVAARSTSLKEYVWDEDAQAANLAVSQAGMELSLAGDDANRRLVLKIARIRAESDERWKTARRMIDASRLIQETLESEVWFVATRGADNDRILITAMVETERVVANIDKTAALIDRVEKAIPRG